MNEADQKKYKDYDQLVQKLTPSSRHLRGYVNAFWVGGLICVLGQCLALLGEKGMGMADAEAGTFASVALIFIATTLTGIGVYDDIGKFAGAGSAVPITGFANAVAAPAIEFRRDGLVMGLGAKLFSLAGPVLTYGIATSAIIGVIYYFLGV